MKKLTVFLFSVILFVTAGAQQFDGLKNTENAFDKFKSKYSLKYDLLSEILQIGLNKGILKGDKNEVSFKSTLYGLFTLFNKDYEIDKYYSKMKFQRNLEVGSAIQLDNDEQKINGFSLSLKYAIINNRDLSDGTYYKELAPQVESLIADMRPFAMEMQNFLNSRDVVEEEKDKLIKFLNENRNITDFNAFFEELETIVSVSDNKESRSFVARMQNKLETLNASYRTKTKEIEKRPLLTFSAEGKNAENLWEFLKFKLEFTKGLGFVKDDQNPWDFYLGAFFDMAKDSLNLNKNLKRSIGSCKGGINHVLIKKQNNQSFVEVLGGFEYNTIFNGKYPEEKSNQLSALFNLTFRMAPNLYLPVELKYDPEKEKFLGQVRLKWDMIRDSNQ